MVAYAGLMLRQFRLIALLVLQELLNTIVFSDRLKSVVTAFLHIRFGLSLIFNLGIALAFGCNWCFGVSFSKFLATLPWGFPTIVILILLVGSLNLLLQLLVNTYNAFMKKRGQGHVISLIS